MGRFCRFEQEAQKHLEPVEEEPEVVACGCEDGVDGIACAVGQVVSAHAMLILDVADDGFDGGAPLHHLLDGISDAAPLAFGEDAELVGLRGVVATISGIGEDALHLACPLELFGVREDGLPVPQPTSIAEYVDA